MHILLKRIEKWKVKYREAREKADTLQLELIDREIELQHVRERRLATSDGSCGDPAAPALAPRAAIVERNGARLAAPATAPCNHIEIALLPILEKLSSKWRRTTVANAC